MSRTMNRLVYLSSACLTISGIVIATSGTVSAASRNDDPKPDPASKQFYTTRVTDILTNNCLDCHDETAKGNLRLDSYASIMKGGVSGPPIIPGHPDKSLLIQAVRRSGDLKMPPKRPLDPAAVADLVAWVKAGAVGADPAPAAVTNQSAPQAQSAPPQVVV